MLYVCIAIIIDFIHSYNEKRLTNYPIDWSNGNCLLQSWCTIIAGYQMSTTTPALFFKYSYPTFIISWIYAWSM